ncbi:hypothetical protein OG749_47190 (plasmid) [Streptomyces nojiriensis]|uniref:hypothetical protein n=1 Tax=Streptomyces nojiriensis TaxID=66374 RepID=UPI002E199631
MTEPTPSPAPDTSAHGETPDTDAPADASSRLHRISAAVRGRADHERRVITGGARHMARQAGRWWSAEDLSAEYLTAFHLNDQYARWKERQDAELDEANRQLNQLRSSTDSHAFKERKAYTREAASIRTENFTPRPPTDADRAATRVARSRNRRWGSAAALGAWTVFATQAPGPALWSATAAAALAATTSWVQGRRPTELNPSVPELDFPVPLPQPTAAAGQSTTDDIPFPIAEAADPESARICILRALRAENIPVADVTEVERKDWGWKALVRVAKGTPATIIAQADNLETLFDLGQGDVIVQPHVHRTACATLLLRQDDMFAGMPPAPYLAPRSIGVEDTSAYGRSSNGNQFAFSLAGLMAEIIARSGGGKSTIIRAFVDVTTACYDAVNIFLDPSGDGPGPYEEAVRLFCHDPALIERVLLWLHCMATGRSRIRRRQGMGDAWQPSAEHPAVIVYIDEFPKLTPLSKQLVASLQLVGRKEGVWIIVAAQGATTEFLGANIAQQPALKMLGACRDVDVRAALGGGRIDEGWLPHRLNPKTGDDLRQCAQIYAEGVPGLPDEPVIHKVHFISVEEGRQRAAERAAAGLVDIDDQSIAGALTAALPPFIDELDGPELATWGELLRLCRAPGAPAGVPVPAIAGHLVGAFEAHCNPEALTVRLILDHLREVEPDRWCRWDDKDETSQLREGGKAIGRALKVAGLKLASTRLPQVGRPTGYRLEDLHTALRAQGVDLSGSEGLPD